MAAGAGGFRSWQPVVVKYWLLDYVLHCVYKGNLIVSDTGNWTIKFRFKGEKININKKKQNTYRYTVFKHFLKFISNQNIEHLDLNSLNQYLNKCILLIIHKIIPFFLLYINIFIYVIIRL